MGTSCGTNSARPSAPWLTYSSNPAWYCRSEACVGPDFCVRVTLRLRNGAFWLAVDTKSATFRRGSASGSGDRPGLQNRWRALRGVFGGFDSHALPPLPLLIYLLFF